MTLMEWIEEYVGEWIVDYPYIQMAIFIILLIIICMALSNMLYWLGKFISGDR